MVKVTVLAEIRGSADIVNPGSSFFDRKCRDADRRISGKDYAWTGQFDGRSDSSVTGLVGWFNLYSWRSMRSIYSVVVSGTRPARVCFAGKRSKWSRCSVK